MPANQYGPVKPLFEKCENPCCSKIVRKTPRQKEIGRSCFCSMACNLAIGRPSKYADGVVGEYVIANLGKLSYIEMSWHWNIKPNAFTHLLDRLRSQGYAIPIRPKRKIKEKQLPPSKLFIMPTKKGLPDKRSNRQGNSSDNHMRRKPPVEHAKVKEMDRRLPNRVIDISSCIKIVFNDKNHSTFYARDEEHEGRIREKYAYLEKGLLPNVNHSG